MVNQNIRQCLEEFQKGDKIEFSRLNWENSLIAPVTTEEVTTRITNLKKKKVPGANQCTNPSTHNTRHNTNKSLTYKLHVYPQNTFQRPLKTLSWF